MSSLRWWNRSPLATAQRDGKKRINYRDLSVQHLGAVYEQLLEREFVFHPESGEILVRLSPYARKTGGSYYTPESLVRLIIRRAVGPLTEEKLPLLAAPPKGKNPSPLWRNCGNWTPPGPS